MMIRATHLVFLCECCLCRTPTKYLAKSSGFQTNCHLQLSQMMWRCEIILIDQRQQLQLAIDLKFTHVLLTWYFLRLLRNRLWKLNYRLKYCKHSFTRSLLVSVPHNIFQLFAFLWPIKNCCLITTQCSAFPYENFQRNFISNLQSGNKALQLFRNRLLENTSCQMILRATS